MVVKSCSTVSPKSLLSIVIFVITTTAVVRGWTVLVSGDRTPDDGDEGVESDENNETSSSDDDTSNQNWSNHGIELPSHVSRELHKTERREKLRSWLIMKTPMYDNILLKCPESRTLGTISLKKANWYVRRGLADWTKTEVGDDSSEVPTASGKCIQLNFTPAGREPETRQRTYNNSIKKNQCVVCGESERGYSRHYIVPYCYRTLFPYHYKAHLPHDIVILCPECHILAEQQSNRRMKHLEKCARNQHHETSQPMMIDPNLRAVKRAAATLWYVAKHKNNQIPKERINALERIVRTSAWFIEKYPSNPDTRVVSPEILQEALALMDERPNPNYISGPELVVTSVVGNDIESFVKAWRTHFVETMDPRFLPVGWAIHAPVSSNVRVKGPTIGRTISATSPITTKQAT